MSEAETTPKPEAQSPDPVSSTRPPSAVPDVVLCDLCGKEMQEWHCRIICTSCGYQRDCSDP